jgi:hypothetical protein
MNSLILGTAAGVVSGLLLAGRMTGAPLQWRNGPDTLPKCTNVRSAMADVDRV